MSLRRIEPLRNLGRILDHKDSSNLRTEHTQKSKMEKILKSSVLRIQLSGVRYKAMVEVGDPKERIIDIANRLGVEMIVLGFVGL